MQKAFRCTTAERDMRGPPQGPICDPLRDHLCRQYSRKRENLTARQDGLGHITIYGCHWYSDVLYPPRRDRQRDEELFESPSRAASVHVFDIGAGIFSLELRNVPMSAALERYIDQLEGTIDEGQTCMSVRLRLRITDVQQVLELAELVRRVRKHRRVDRFGGTVHDSLMIHRALVEFATVLDAINVDPAGRAEVRLSQQEWEPPTQ